VLNSLLFEGRDSGRIEQSANEFFSPPVSADDFISPGSAFRRIACLSPS
jgi:hypothetical protein